MKRVEPHYIINLSSNVGTTLAASLHTYARPHFVSVHRIRREP